MKDSSNLDWLKIVRLQPKSHHFVALLYKVDIARISSDHKSEVGVQLSLLISKNQIQ